MDLLTLAPLSTDTFGDLYRDMWCHFLSGQHEQGINTSMLKELDSHKNFTNSDRNIYFPFVKSMQSLNIKTARPL